MVFPEPLILQDLNLPLPSGFQPDPDIEWEHPTLIFLAEHNRIPKSPKEEVYGVPIIQRVIERGRWIGFYAYETIGLHRGPIGLEPFFQNAKK